MTQPPAHIYIRRIGGSGKLIALEPAEVQCNIVSGKTVVLKWKRLGYKQVPLHACTYHKVQGMTLPAVILDLGEDRLTVASFMVGITRASFMEHLAFLRAVSERLLPDFGNADVIATYNRLHQKHRANAAEYSK